MSNVDTNRRKFLMAGAGVAVGLPFLEAFAPRTAKAQAVQSRLIIAFSPNGTNNLAKFMPQGTGANFTLGEESDPLIPFKSKLLAISGVNMDSAEDGGDSDLHAGGMAALLTGSGLLLDPKLQMIDSTVPVGYAQSLSIDQHIASQIGTATRFKSLEFGVQTSVRFGNHPFTRMVYAGSQMPVSPEDSPLAAYARMFGGTPASGTGAAMVDANLQRRKSVLDFVLGEFTAVQGAVPQADQMRLDQHATALRELERSLTVATPINTASCAQNAFSPVADPLLHANFPMVCQQQADLLTLGLACGLTRVTSLQYSYARSQEFHNWISTAGCGVCLPTVAEDHHTMTHEGGSPPHDATLALINRWYSQQLAYLLGRLDSVNEGAATLLDNSLLFWGSEVATGFDHSYKSMRAFLFGTAGGKTITGQHLQFAGEPHNKLLVSLAQAMGVPITTFGNHVYSGGGLAGVLTA